MHLYQLCIALFLLSTFLEHQCAALPEHNDLTHLSLSEKNRALQRLMAATTSFEEPDTIAAIKQLIRAGANPNILEYTEARTGVDYGSKRLLFVYRHNDEMVAFLLKHGADPNMIVCDGCPAVFFAIKESIFRTMIAYGANIHSRGLFHDETILHRIIRDPHAEFSTAILEYCIQQGVPVDAKDEYGDTPLHNLALACDYHNKVIPLLIDKVNVLLRAGYSVDIANEKKKTVFDIVHEGIAKAKEKKDLESVRSYKQILMMCDFEQLRRLDAVESAQAVLSPIVASKSRSNTCLSKQD